MKHDAEIETPDDDASLPMATSRRGAAPVICDRYRIRFAKTGLLRWIGHRDLLRLWERMLRRTGLQVTMTTGFHPRARIAFPSALPLGVEGLEEVVEIELAESISAEALRQRLIDDDQPGLAIGQVVQTATNGGNGDGSAYSPGLAKARHHSSEYEIEIPADFLLTEVDQAIQRLADMPVLTIVRKEKPITISVPHTFPDVARRGQQICVTQVESEGASLKITDLLDAMGLAELMPAGAIIRRTRLHLIDELQPNPLRSFLSSKATC